MREITSLTQGMGHKELCFYMGGHPQSGPLLRQTTRGGPLKACRSTAETGIFFADLFMKLANWMRWEKPCRLILAVSRTPVYLSWTRTFSWSNLLAWRSLLGLIQRTKWGCPATILDSRSISEYWTEVPTVNKPEWYIQMGHIKKLKKKITWPYPEVGGHGLGPHVGGFSGMVRNISLFYLLTKHMTLNAHNPILCSVIILLSALIGNLLTTKWKIEQFSHQCNSITLVIGA